MDAASALQRSAIAMHFAKHTKYASEQICKLMYFEPHPFFACRSIRSMHAQSPRNSLRLFMFRQCNNSNIHILHSNSAPSQRRRWFVILNGEKRREESRLWDFFWDTPAEYSIRVVGFLDERWSDQLGSITILSTESGKSGEKPVTTLTDTLVDQTALIGVLNCLYNNRYPMRLPAPSPNGCPNCCRNDYLRVSSCWDISSSSLRSNSIV